MRRIVHAHNGEGALCGDSRALCFCGDERKVNCVNCAGQRRCDCTGGGITGYMGAGCGVYLIVECGGCGATWAVRP